MSDARIHDRGYRAYEGERSGIPGAVRSVSWHAMRAVLGIGRPARHKIFPAVAAVIAFLPAVVFVGLAALFPVDLLCDLVQDLVALAANLNRRRAQHSSCHGVV